MYTASWLPIVMVPLVCLVGFSVTLITFFYYVESDNEPEIIVSSSPETSIPKSVVKEETTAPLPTNGDTSTEEASASQSVSEESTESLETSDNVPTEAPEEVETAQD